MTDLSQVSEIDILGCRVKTRPEDSDKDIAESVIQLVQKEVTELQKARPQLKPADVAVLVALKIATEKVKMEQDFKSVILKIESSVESALSPMQSPS